MEKTKVNEIELFSTLVSDCKDIITERVWASRTEIIIAHGEIGQRIVNDPLYKKYSKQNKDFLDKLARSIGISYSETCRSVQFYEKFKIISSSGDSWAKFKEGKNITWQKVKQEYLPQLSLPGESSKEKLQPKFVVGDEVRINGFGAIIVVKSTKYKIIYKVATETEDIWISEEFLKKQNT